MDNLSIGGVSTLDITLDVRIGHIGYMDTRQPNRIRELRHQRGMSLLELADALGTTPTQISKLEKGTRRLSQDWMRRIAGALECHPADLISNPLDELLSPEETAILKLYRGMTVAERATAYKVIHALKESSPEPALDPAPPPKKNGTK